ncbi:MAG: hypothetical protein ACK4WD_03775 [Flavobacteriales bacterium]|jgi:hypothetical protein
MNENNLFLRKFGERIDNYWDVESSEREILRREILEYANANPVKFRREFEAVMFDEDILPLPLVIEVLATDTDNWGDFFVHLLDDILQAARDSDDPNDILSYLQDFDYLDEDPRPFIGDIVKRLERELDGDHLEIECAAIWVIPVFLENPHVRNKEELKRKLVGKLNSPNWKVRVVAFNSLGYTDFLPEGAKLSLMDRIFKRIFGEPPMI